MARQTTKLCPACKQLFRGRSNAVTCSVRCRKRLSRARAGIQKEVRQLAEIPKAVVKEIESVVEPNATQEGFITIPAVKRPFAEPKLESLEHSVTRPQPRTGFGSMDGFSRPVEPKTEVKQDFGLEDNYYSKPEPIAEVPFSSPTERYDSPQPSSPTLASYNHGIDSSYHPFKSFLHPKFAALLLLIIVASATMMVVSGMLSNHHAQQNQNLASSQTGSNSQNVLQASPSSLDLNVDTNISKKLAITGQVAIQNEADSSRAFSVQNAAGDNLFVIDTQHQKIGIGSAPAASGAILQVAGDVSANNIAASGDVTSNGGKNVLNNNGLTINSVLVCTANGCSSSVPIPSISSAVANLNVANVAFINKGQTFVGDNTFTGQTTFKAISTKAFQIQNATGTDNIFYVDTNNNRIGIGTIPINGGAALQVAGSIDLSTGSYQVGGTSGTSLSCPAGQLLQQAIIQGGIVTSGSCVAVAGATTPSLQQVYDASAPAKIGLSSASGQFQIQDSASPLGTSLFSVTNNGASTTYFAVNSLGISVTGNVNTTGQYQINGTQIASTNLGDSSNLGRLNGTQTFTGANTFNNAGNSFTGDGSGITNVNATKLNGQMASFYTDAGSLSTGTLSDSRLSANVTRAGNSFNGASQLVQLTAGGILPILSGANLTSLNASNISSGTLSDSRLSANVALLPNNNTFTGNNSFHLNSAALTVQDASSPLGTDLFEVTDNAGTTKYLAVSASGVKVGAFDVCTTAGNCAGVGGGVTTAGGTTNKLAKFTASSGIGDSIITDNGTTVTVGGNLAANNITQNGNNVCDTSGNCTGVSGGSIGGSGTANKIALFTGSGFTIGNSILTQASTTVTAAGSINVTGAYQLNGTQVDSTILSNDGNLAKLNGTQTFTGANTFSNASNSFTGDGSGLTGLNASNVLTGTLADARLSTNVAFLAAAQTFSGINNFTNVSNTFAGDGSSLTALNAGNISSGTLSDSRLSSNVALLNGTGPQTFTGNNKFTGTLLSNVTNANAVEIQNSGGSSTLFNADTSAMRIAVAQATASYTLDVAGDINTTGAFRVGGTAGTGITCTSGNVIQNPVVVGGIITGGTCVANGGGVTTTLQDAYNNSSSPALITTTSSTKGILLKAGSTFDSNNLFQVENAAGNNMFNINSNTSSVTIGGGINSTTAFQVQNSSAQNILDVDTANNQINIVTLSTPGTVIAMQAPAAPTVTPTGATGSTSYSYEITAVSNNGAETLASTVGSTTTGNATLSSANYNAISWSSVTGASLYKVYRTVGGGTLGLVGSTASTSFNDVGYTAGGSTPSLASSGSLSTSTTYYYKVTALDNSGGETLASSEANITTTSSYNTVTLSWAPVAGARSYRLYRGTTSGGENTYYASYANGYTDTGASGIAASPPSASSAYANNLGNNSASTITLNNSGVSAATIYVGSNVSTSPVGTLSGVGTVGSGTLAPLQVVGSYAYSAGGTYPNNYLQVIDVSNPAAPVLAGTVGSLPGINKIIVAGNYAYLATQNGSPTLSVVNISNKSNPAVVGSVNNTQLGAVINMSIQGNYLYAMTQSGKFEVIDISNPANPVLASSLSLAGGSSNLYDTAVSGSYAYVAGSGGSWTINISNPFAPSLVSSSGAIKVSGTILSPDGLRISGGYLYDANSASGLLIYSLGNPANPVLVGQENTGSIAGEGVYVSGRYAYMSYKGWKIEDISNPQHPFVVASQFTNTAVMNIAAQGRYMYTVDSNSNVFSVYDLGGAYIQNLQTGATEAGSLQVDTDLGVGGNASIQGGLDVGQGLAVGGNIGTSGNLVVSGNLSGSGINSPIIPSISTGGTSGSTTYSYQVVAVTAYGTTAPSHIATITTGNAVLSSTNYVSLTWGTVSGASSYNVYRTASGGSPSTTGYIGSSATNTFKDTGLAASGSVPTTDASGNLKVSGGFQIQNSSGTALLTSDTNNMRINIDSTFGAVSTSAAAINVLNAPAAPTVTATGTTGTKSYSYKIAAVTRQGLVAVTSSAGSTTSGNATLNGTNYNAISWTAVSGANSYNIYRTSSSGSPASTGLIGSTSGTSFNDTGLGITGTIPTATGLTNGTTYYYKIAGIDAAGGESLLISSTEYSMTMTATSQSVTLFWNSVPGVVGYRVYRGTSPGGEVGYFATANDYLVDNGSPQNNTTATPPTLNMAYKISGNSNNNLQLSVGGLGTAAGQLYVSGTLPSSPIATISTASNVFSLGSFGHYIFSQSSAATLQVIDVSTPAGPLNAASITTGTYNSVASGHYIYTEGSNTFRVYDVSNPDNPTQVGSTTVAAGASRDAMAVSGRYVYIATNSNNNNNDSLEIVDVSNPATPKQVSTLYLGNTDSGTSVLSLAVSGNYAYIAGKTSGTLTAVDVSNPTNPLVIDTLSGYLNPADLVMQGHFLYMTTGSGSMFVQVMDAANPSYIYQLSSVGISQSPVSSAISGRYLYIGTSAGSGAINVVDISNPYTPVLDGSIPNVSASQLLTSGRYLYAVASSQVQVFDMGGEVTQGLEAGIADIGSLQVDSNAQIGGDASLTGGLNVGHSAQIAGSLGVSGGAVVQGGVIISGGANQLGAPSAPTVTPTGTTGSTTYSYVVTALNSSGGETVASSVGTTTSGNSSLSGTNYNAISWSGVSGATSYNIYRTAGGSNQGLIGTTSGTSFNDTSTNNASTSTTAPTTDTTGQLTVQGSALFKNATNSTTAFQIQNSSGLNVINVDTTNQSVSIVSLSTPGTITAMQAPAAPTVTPTGTAGSTTYNYVITAISSNGAETLTTAAGTTSTGNATLSATNYNALSWSSVSGASFYRIYRTAGGSTQGLVGSTVSSTAFNDTGFTASVPTPALASSGSLSTSTAYYYKITALDSAGGETTASTEATITTSSTNTTVTLSWAPISGARSYRVYRGASSGGENTYYSTTANSYTDTGSTGTSAGAPTSSNAYADNLTNGAGGNITIAGSNNSVGQIYVGAPVPTTPAGQITLNDSNEDCVPRSGYLFCTDASVPAVVVYDLANPSNPVKVTSISTLTNPDTIVLNGHYAYVSDGFLGYAVQIYDISNPYALSLVSTTTTQMSSLDARALNMAVSGHYAYVITGTKNSLQVLDITNPSSPVWVDNATLPITPVNGAHDTILINGRYMFVQASTTTAVYDLSNPAAPSFVTTLSFVVHSIQGRYAFSGSGSNFAIYDISQISSPVLASSTSYASSGCNGIGGRSVAAGRYAYVNCNSAPPGYVTVDISNVFHPIVLGTTPLVSSSQLSNMLVVQGRYLYTTTNNGTPYNLYIFDLGGEYAQTLQTGIAETGQLTVDSDTNIYGNSNIQGSLAVGGPVQIAGALGLSGGASIQGGIVLGGGGNQLSTPAAPTVTPTGTTGSTSYSYVITAMNAYGGETVGSSAGTTASGNATLSGTNYNALSWTSVSGASGYKIYRTLGGSSTGLIGTSTTNSFNDTGLNGASTTSAPTINTTGQLTVQGSALFKNAANSTSAFQIQNSSGTSLLAADTSGMKIAITGNLNVSGNVEVGGYLITDGGMYATSLPGSPVNGQEVYYDADPTNGIVWHLRYNSTSTYWEYLGGSSFYSAVETSETAPGTWGDMATVGPSVTVPLAGDYIVSYSTYVSDEASAGSASVGVAINGTENASTTSGLGMNSGDLGFGQLASTTRLTLSASDVVKLVYQASGSSSLQYRHLTVTPVRVH